MVHEPVLAKEAIRSLNIRIDGTYVDCTFGRGGHSNMVLKGLGPNGRLLAIDRDPKAIEYGRETNSDVRLELVHARFSNLEEILEQRALRKGIDGILMDLGVSSPQLDDAERGFSFRADGPLDMRMDPGAGRSAAQWLATVKENDLRRCLREFGEERFAGRIARRIVEARQQKPIETTRELAAIVKRAVPRSNEKIDPATRTFQAIRLQVNDELEELSLALSVAVDNLAVGGRAAVIAFHSLEDRIVKRFFRNTVRRQNDAFLRVGASQFSLVTRKPIRPNEDELARNPRARSARLRVLERIA